MFLDRTDGSIRDLFTLASGIPYSLEICLIKSSSTILCAVTESRPSFISCSFVLVGVNKNFSFLPATATPRFLLNSTISFTYFFCPNIDPMAIYLSKKAFVGSNVPPKRFLKLKAYLPGTSKVLLSAISLVILR